MLKQSFDISPSPIFFFVLGYISLQKINAGGFRVHYSLSCLLGTILCLCISSVSLSSLHNFESTQPCHGTYKPVSCSWTQTDATPSVVYDNNVITPTISSDSVDAVEGIGKQRLVNSSQNQPVHRWVDY